VCSTSASFLGAGVQGRATVLLRPSGRVNGVVGVLARTKAFAIVALGVGINSLVGVAGLVTGILARGVLVLTALVLFVVLLVVVGTLTIVGVVEVVVEERVVVLGVGGRASGMLARV